MGKFRFILDVQKVKCLLGYKNKKRYMEYKGNFKISPFEQKGDI